jgi:hypothetical protein
MPESYRHCFGLHKEPFAADIPRQEILVTKTLTADQRQLNLPSGDNYNSRNF